MSDNSLPYNKDNKIPIHKTYDIPIALNRIVHKVIRVILPYLTLENNLHKHIKKARDI